MAAGFQAQIAATGCPRSDVRHGGQVIGRAPARQLATVSGEDRITETNGTTNKYARLAGYPLDPVLLRLPMQSLTAWDFFRLSIGGQGFFPAFFDSGIASHAFAAFGKKCV